ncbi:hypothetical protein A9Q84_00035 [Halobacteriovorax marinus]|uniref:Uncharacterized protein n=1 Tax=Halobacteriovorax marinus TaxID=97084 RepID=A0A1Y5FJQ4_9BACT|nr:hypothetical protein A9Q84_00035 [Halobacteriovorax marinus]
MNGYSKFSYTENCKTEDISQESSESITQVLIGEIDLRNDFTIKDRFKELLVSKKVSAASVLLPVIFFELLVCILGSKFYLSIGFDFFTSIVLAVTTETFYMYFSSMRSVKASFIRTVLLTVSITTLSYSAYQKDTNVMNLVNSLESDISESRNRLKEVSTEIVSLKKEELNIERDMEVYRKHDLASKGNRVLAPRRLELSNRRIRLSGERGELRQFIEKKSTKLSSQSFIGNIKILTIQTLITIVTFSIIQLSICIALPQILTEIKE